MLKTGFRVETRFLIHLRRTMKRVIVFDVNETLLDLSVLRPYFAHAFGDAGIIQQWFPLLLHSSLVTTLSNTYSDFGVLAKSALEMVADANGVTLGAEDRDAILAGVRNLPPHGDVKPALARLRARGYRLATLTNSSYAMLTEQMTNAGLVDFFDMLLSVEDVKMFKPAEQVYRMGAEKLGVEIHQIRLVAAHDWDVHGALRAGCAGAFIARDGKSYHPQYEKPDVMGRNLGEIVEEIFKLDQ
jgi:2-haloacid dehalogenase